MRTRWAAGLSVWGTLAAAAIAAGCSSKEPTSNPVTGAAGQGGSAVSSAGTSSVGGAVAGSGGACASPAAAAVPDAWVRPAQCNGVGNLCSEGCQGAACQLIGDVCIPFKQIGASADACTPYCLAFACMSFDDASCFCTGSAAAQAPACACGPKAVAGVCAAEGASCASTPCCDCMGLTCTTDAVSGSVCRQACSKDADCVTGCCNTTSGRCQDALYCNCAAVAATCAGDKPCCPGSSCLTFSESTDNPPYSCFDDCKTQTDCATGCCSLPIPGLDHGACGPCQ
jgi:hypothetical protein